MRTFLVTMPDKTAYESDYSAADLANKITGSLLAEDYVFGGAVTVEEVTSPSA